MSLESRLAASQLVLGQLQELQTEVSVGPAKSTPALDAYVGEERAASPQPYTELFKMLEQRLNLSIAMLSEGLELSKVS